MSQHNQGRDQTVSADKQIESERLVWAWEMGMDRHYPEGVAVPEAK